MILAIFSAIQGRLKLSHLLLQVGIGSQEFLNVLVVLALAEGRLLDFLLQLDVKQLEVCHLIFHQTTLNFSSLTTQTRALSVFEKTVLRNWHILAHADQLRLRNGL